jgi:hypothetical protein
MSEWQDEDGYPTADALRRISAWPCEDTNGLFTFIHSLWWSPDWGWKQTVREDGTIKYDFSTGGWSGNEALIEALQENGLVWHLCWESSRRGGHYEFSSRAWDTGQGE